MVADLLRDVVRAHEQAKKARTDARTDDHRTWVTQAQAALMQALEDDPEQRDQAWRALKCVPSELLAFYAAELAKDPEQQRLQAQVRRARTPAALAQLKQQQSEMSEVAKSGVKMPNAPESKTIQ